MSLLYRFGKDQSLGCVRCGKCCGKWPVPVSKADAERISKLKFPELGMPVSKCFSGGHIAKKNGRCVFSGDGNLCLIHKKYGLDAKPLACRLYPLEVHNWDDGSVSASLRYDCPAVAHGGKCSLPSAVNEIAGFSAELERIFPKDYAIYNRKLDPGSKRLFEIAHAYDEILNSGKAAPEVRIYAAAQLLALHSAKGKDRDITGAEDFAEDASALFERSIEHLAGTIDSGSEKELSYDYISAFRYLLASFLRDDAGVPFTGRLRRTLETVGFVYGHSSLADHGLRFNGGDLFKNTSASKAEPEAMKTFFRYLSGRIVPMHFCGSPAQYLTFEEGMLFLLAVYPVTMTVAGVLSAKEKRQAVSEKNMADALMLVDHSFLSTGLYRTGQLLRMSRKVVFGDDFPILLSRFK